MGSTRNIVDSKGWLMSVYPCTEYLTFGPWIYMVPQYKCTDVLMLGYAGGTTAGLIRLFYGNIPIVAIDNQPCDDYYNVDLIRAEAEEWVKNNKRPFDAVVIDLSDVVDDPNDYPPKFVTSQPFVDALKSFARYIIVHAHKDTDMSIYGKPLKVLQLNEARFYYYMVYEIPIMPIR